MIRGVFSCYSSLLTGWAAESSVLRAYTKPKSNRPVLWVAGVLPGALGLLIAGTFYYATSVSALSVTFYLPVLFAASLFGVSGGAVVGLLTACCAALLSGPGEAGRALLDGGSYVVLGCAAGALFRLGRARLEAAERRVHTLSSLYDQTLSSLAKTFEVRDQSTQGHCERVARNALVLGNVFELSAQQLELLYWSALLHDVGKISVPEHILLKDTRLSPDEYAQVKEHADYGADLLLSVSETFDEVASIVRSHHERFDGTGYPRRLKGEEIPLLSRIISVVDVFEALTSQRPYREPMKPVHALHHIRERAGSQFDANVVAAFEACYRQGDIDFAPEAAQLLEPPPSQQANLQSVLS